MAHFLRARHKEAFLPQAPIGARRSTQSGGIPIAQKQWKGGLKDFPFSEQGVFSFIELVTSTASLPVYLIWRKQQQLLAEGRKHPLPLNQSWFLGIIQSSSDPRTLWESTWSAFSMAFSKIAACFKCTWIYFGYVRWFGSPETSFHALHIPKLLWGSGDQLGLMRGIYMSCSHIWKGVTTLEYLWSDMSSKRTNGFGRQSSFFPGTIEAPSNWNEAEWPKALKRDGQTKCIGGKGTTEPAGGDGGPRSVH